MAKIIKLFTEAEAAQQRLIERAEELLDMAKNGEIINIVIAAQHTDGNVVTGYCNADVGERQFLAAHLQTDIMFDVVKVNADQLIEYIE